MTKQLKMKVLSDSDQENDEDSESWNDDGGVPHADYENVPDEDRVVIKRLASRLLSSTRDDDTIYSQGKARIFALVCNILEIDYTHIDLARKSAKRFLYDSILGLVRTTNPFLLFTNLVTPAPGDNEPCQGDRKTGIISSMARIQVHC